MIMKVFFFNFKFIHIPLFLLIMSMLFAMLGGLLVIDGKQLLSDSILVDAIVVGHQDRGDQNIVDPIFEYIDSTGTSIQTKAGTAFLVPVRKVGTKAELIVNANLTNGAMVNSVENVYYSAIPFIILSIILFTLTGFLFVVQSKMKSKSI